jgi:hypothetical protein
MERDPDEERRRQIMTIHKIANRLPWITVGVALVAFMLIFLQAYYASKPSS